MGGRSVQKIKKPKKGKKRTDNDGDQYFKVT